MLTSKNRNADRTRPLRHTCTPRPAALTLQASLAFITTAFNTAGITETATESHSKPLNNLPVTALREDTVSDSGLILLSSEILHHPSSSSSSSPMQKQTCRHTHSKRFHTNVQINTSASSPASSASPPSLPLCPPHLPVPLGIKKRLSRKTLACILRDSAPRAV